MLKIIAPLAALAMIVTAGSALANDKTGKIVKIDPARDEIQVENVTVKIEGVKVEGLAVGDTVLVTFFEDDNGNHMQSIKKQ